MIADALNRRKHLLTTLAIFVPGFERIKTKTLAPSIKKSVRVSISSIHTLAFMMDIYSMVVASVCQIHLSESMLSGNSIPKDATDIWVVIRPSFLLEIDTIGLTRHPMFLVSVSGVVLANRPKEARRMQGYINRC